MADQAPHAHPGNTDHTAANMKGWQNFMRAATYGIIFVVIVLLLMRFLLV